MSLVNVSKWLLSLCMVLTLCACGDDTNTVVEEEPEQSNQAVYRGSVLDMDDSPILIEVALQGKEQTLVSTWDERDNRHTESATYNDELNTITFLDGYFECELGNHALACNSSDNPYFELPKESLESNVSMQIPGRYLGRLGHVAYELTVYNDDGAWLDFQGCAVTGWIAASTDIDNLLILSFEEMNPCGLDINTSVVNFVNNNLDVMNLELHNESELLPQTWIKQ